MHMFFAQKGVIVNKKGELLLSKYSYSKYQKKKLNGKLCLPGGKIRFGENIDESFKREVHEETGIIIKPGFPFYIFQFIYKKENIPTQIVVVVRYGIPAGGRLIKNLVNENESSIEYSKWYKLKDINYKDVVFDEVPAIKNFIIINKHQNHKFRNLH